MAKNDICWLSATELTQAIRRKQLSPVEVTRAILDRIDQLNPQFNAFVTLTDKAALRDARKAEKMLMQRSASLGPLHGVPFSTKDLVITKGVRTTFGTPLFADNVPTEDAPMVARMKSGRGYSTRQNKYANIRLAGCHAQSLVRANPESVERRPDTGWLKRRGRSSNCSRPGTSGHRNGWGRLDSDSFVVQRSVWDQAVLWSDSGVSAERSLEFVACWADDADGGRCCTHAERHGRTGRTRSVLSASGHDRLCQSPQGLNGRLAGGLVR